MAFIRVTPPDEAVGETQSMYERQEARFGYVPNYAKVFSERPAIMRLWSDLLSGLRKNMETRRFELITLAASLEIGSSYCALAHARVLGERFLSEDELEAVVSGSSDPLSALERTMMDVARKVCANASSVTQHDVDSLRGAGLTDAEIFDVLAVAAARCFFANLVDGLGAEPDATFREMSGALRKRLVVGRPIAAATPDSPPEPGA